MTKWSSHYTGKYLEGSFLRINLFCAKERNDVWRMLRLSFKKRMIGIHFRQNYAKHIAIGGFQIFTNKLHFGLAQRGPKKMSVVWSGSVVDPNSSVTIVYRRLVIGMKTPKWLKKRKEKADELKWSKMPF